MSPLHVGIRTSYRQMSRSRRIFRPVCVKDSSALEDLVHISWSLTSFRIFALVMPVFPASCGRELPATCGAAQIPPLDGHRANYKPIDGE